ncbi:MAG: arginine--tRNA ligase [bacterium]|nr:arginine--tRNA ligase [bacterium]
MSTIKQEITELVKEAIYFAANRGEIGNVDVEKIYIEIPKRKEYGDFTTNIAFSLAKEQGVSPHIVAKAIVRSIKKNETIEHVEVSEHGFINFFISKHRLYKVLKEIMEKDTEFGGGDLGRGKKVIIEFVSANPTGPLHVGHGRGAAYGDTVANILAFLGYEVVREYYINDVGTQIDNLGKSVKARYLQLLGQDVPFQDEWYKGEYIIDLGNKLVERYGNTARDYDISFFIDFAKLEILEGIKQTLAKFRVYFTNFISEKALYESGEVKKVVDKLDELCYLYKDKEAILLKTKEFDDEKDRVIIRSDGSPTYFLGDIAYHKNKFERSPSFLINVLGQDHHGYVERLKASLSALGYPKDSLKILLYQLVTLTRCGNPVSMSTREGEFVTLDEVIDEVGVDASRFFFISKKLDTHLDFDLELAKKRNLDNPVFYVQYAHARICSILDKAKKMGIELGTYDSVDLSLLRLEEELSIIKKLSLFPDEIRETIYEPSHLTLYLIEVATRFHNYYNHYRVISSNLDLTLARLTLVNCIRIVLRNVLKLLGISFPEKM